MAIWRIPEDGVYEYPNGTRIKYRKGHMLDISAKDNIKKVAEFRIPRSPEFVAITDPVPQVAEETESEEDNEMDNDSVDPMYFIEHDDAGETSKSPEEVAEQVAEAQGIELDEEVVEKAKKAKKEKAAKADPDHENKMAEAPENK